MVSPEHHRTFGQAGWSKARLYEELYRLCEIPAAELVAGAQGIAEGGAASLAAKSRGDVFLHRLGERLGERGIAFKHYAKPTNTRVAPLPLRQQIAAEVDLVIEGLSD